MRRAAVQAVGGYHAEFEPAEDLDLWLRLGEVGRLVLATFPEVLMKYRQHARSFSEQHQREPVAAGGPALPDANLQSETVGGGASGRPPGGAALWRAGGRPGALGPSPAPRARR